MSREFSIFARQTMCHLFPAELTVAVQRHGLRIQSLKALCGAGCSGAQSLYFRPKTLDEAVSLLASGAGRFWQAGQIFIRLSASDCRRGASWISRAPGIRGISMERENDSHWRADHMDEVIRTPLPRCFDALKAAAREVGSVQIQNRGTVAGNLCNASPAADGVPPLLALDAEVELVRPAGKQASALWPSLLPAIEDRAARAMRFCQPCWFRGKWRMRLRSFLKLGARRYLVISISMVAAVVHADGAGSVAEAHSGGGIVFGEGAAVD